MAQEAQGGDHDEVADGEVVALEPALVAQPVGEPLELQPGEVGGALPAQLGPFLVLVENVDQEEVEDRRLDAVERRISPLNRAEPALRIGGQKRLAPFADILNDRAALENLDLAVAKARHLVERLFV